MQYLTNDKVPVDLKKDAIAEFPRKTSSKEAISWARLRSFGVDIHVLDKMRQITSSQLTRVPN